jgi:hypothetical protein
MKYLVALIVLLFFILSNGNLLAQLDPTGHIRNLENQFEKISPLPAQHDIIKKLKVKKESKYLVQFNTNRRNGNEKILNSIVSKPTKITCSYSYRITYTYDNSGNILTELGEGWNNNAWDNWSRYTYTYDNSGNNLSYLVQRWDNNKWLNYSRNTYTYNNSGKLLTNIYEDNLNSDFPVKFRKDTFTYDNAGNQLTEYRAKWDNNGWVDYQRITKTYDNFNHCLTILYEYNTTGAWDKFQDCQFTYDISGHILTENWLQFLYGNIILYKFTHTYDNYGNQLTYLQEVWENDIFSDGYRNTNTYDNSGNRLTHLAERMSANVWTNDTLFTYTYDNSGKQLACIQKYWWVNKWLNYVRTTSTYENSGSLLTFIYEEGADTSWSYIYKLTYTNDYTGNPLVELGEDYYNNAWANSTKCNYTYDNYANCIRGENYYWISGSWKPNFSQIHLLYNNKQDYFDFTGFTVDIEYEQFLGTHDGKLYLNTFNLLQNYPNPFNPNTKIVYTIPKDDKVLLTVYNILGSKVASLVNEYKPAGSYEVQFNGSNFSSGVYFYKLEAGRYTQIKKMMIIK